jgi:hypothetical protein
MQIATKEIVLKNSKEHFAALHNGLTNHQHHHHNLLFLHAIQSLDDV